MSEVLIVPTGAANVASVRAAFQRLGLPSRITNTPADVLTAQFVVLPGVGSFEAGMRGLREGGFDAPLVQRVAQGLPTLAICLGLQLFASSSEEAPGVDGLGIWPGAVKRLPPSPLLPQMGWNRMHTPVGSLVAPGDAYFANSYALLEAPAGWLASLSRFGVDFVSAVEKGRVLACQLHPELSGAWGDQLLRRWLSGERAPVTAQAEQDGRPVRIIPCLDVRGGRVVKGVRFQDLRDAGDPADQAARYAQMGADELVVLDVSATEEERGAAKTTVEAVRAVLNIPLTVGGGVRSVADAAGLLNAGADKVGINTAAVENPGLIDDLATQFGRQCVVVAVDAARSLSMPSGYEVVTRSGKCRTGVDAAQWCRDAMDRGAGELILTSWDQDGTRAGYENNLIGAVANAVRVPLIASGGAAGASDLVEAFKAGADGALAASIFHDGDLTVAELKAQLSQQGVIVR